MFIIKDFSVEVKTLKEDTYYLLCSLQKYMASKGNDKDFVPYYNPKFTNFEYWGDGYKLLCEIVNLPTKKRNQFDCILVKEGETKCAGIHYYYKGKSYNFYLERKYSAHHKMMDRINEIFRVEDEDRKIIKQWKYLTYVMS